VQDSLLRDVVSMGDWVGNPEKRKVKAGKAGNERRPVISPTGGPRMSVAILDENEKERGGGKQEEKGKKKKERSGEQDPLVNHNAERTIVAMSIGRHH